MTGSRRHPPAWLFYCFLVLFVWIPLPRASNRPEAWGLLEILTFFLLQVWLWQQFRQFFLHAKAQQQTIQHDLKKNHGHTKTASELLL